MIFISKLQFKNVTIIYDEEKVNKKLCKKKSGYMNLWYAISALLMFALLIFGAWITCDMSMVVSIPMLLILFLVVAIGFTSLGYWLVYHKTIKAFLFMEWLFRMEEVYADWYNNKILLRVQHSNGIDDYSLQGFVRNIKNELVITDRSDRNKPIHIYIDVTNKDKTDIWIENIEN